MNIHMSLIRVSFITLVHLLKYAKLISNDGTCHISKSRRERDDSRDIPSAVNTITFHFENMMKTMSPQNSASSSLIAFIVCRM